MAFEPSKATVTAVGTVVAPAESKFDGNLHELRIAVNHRRKDQSGEYVDDGTTWFTYKANGEYGEALKEYETGDRIKVIDASLQTREYQKRDGSTGLANDLRYGSIEVLEKKSERQPVGAESAW